MEQLPNTKLETTSAIRLNNYNKNIMFTLKDYTGLYVGIKTDYAQLGIYDNTKNTLFKITDNKKLYNLLTGNNLSIIALAGSIASGGYSLEDVIEFYKICELLNMKFYDNLEEQDNKDLYKIITKEIKRNNKQ